MDADSILGNAILKTADSPVHAPETFRDALLHKHLDAASRTAVAQTCKAGLAWMLQDWAKDATLRLPVRATSAERAPELLRRFLRAKQQLDQRQSSKPSRPTSIVLQQQGWMPRADTTWWHAPIAALASSAPPPTVTLRLQRTPTALLEYAGAAWPAPTSLSLGQLRGAEGAVKLPPTTALPALRRLTVGWVGPRAQGQLWASVGPYLPQLQSLAIEKQPAPASTTERPAWASVFSASTHSYTLHSLTVPCNLTPWLVQLLQQYTTALQTVTVRLLSSSELGVESVASVCSWTTIVCTDKYTIPHQVLSWLPMPASGNLVLDIPGPGGLSVELPISDEVARRLRRVQFTRWERVTLLANTPMASAAQAQAFRAVLPHIQHLQSQACSVNLHHCTMTPALAAELAAAAAAGWPLLCLQKLTWPTAPSPVLQTPLTPLDLVQLSQPLTDHVLGELMQCMSKVYCLCVPGLQLRTARPAGAVLPWPRLTVEGQVDMGEWVRQAELLGGDVEWICYALTVSMSADQDSSGLVSRLSNLRISRVDKLTFRPENEYDSKTEVAMLRGAMPILNALSCKPKELHFQSVLATAEVVSEFKALLTMPCLQSVEPSDATFQLTPFVNGRTRRRVDGWPLSKLPQYIPRSYSAWRINPAHLRPKELNAFIKTAATLERTATSPLTIKVIGRDSSWAAAMTALLLKGGMSPYLSLVADSDV